MKQKQPKQPSTKQGMWDLLLPILIIITVLPWIVHLAIYSCGYADYDWYSTNDIIADLYCYYKSYFLDIVAIFAAIILAFRLGLYKEKRKSMKHYLPLFAYAVFVLLSTVFSVNVQASIQGNFESFESCLVLLSYLVLSLYAYQIMEYERDYKIIWYAIVGISVAFSIMGILQMSGYDFMDFSWVQRLLMSQEEFAQYGGTLEDTFSGGRVYLTLYNPNYAGIVLAMLFTVIFVMCVTERDKRKKAAYGCFSGILLVLTWYTYARASLLAIAVTLCCLLYLQCKSGRLKMTTGKGIIASLLVVFVIGIFIALDYTAGFPYLSRLIETNDREPLESITTNRDGVSILYDGTSYSLWMDEKNIYCKNETTEDTIAAAQNEELNLPMEADAKALYMEDTESILMLSLADTTLHFVKQEDGYYYRTVNGKTTEMTDICAADFHGLEYLGSARGYIWSRVIPLLKDYLLIGSGPDTFPEVFPQNDYAGKIVYSDRPDMVIEKAHNDYLTKWVQTGMLSLLCIITFYSILLWQGKKAYGKTMAMDTMENRIGYGCYLACIVYMTASLFNDSTLQTSPLFWVFTGIALAGIQVSARTSNN